MPKEDAIKLEGEIVDVMPNATFKIKLDGKADVTILGYISGKMRKNEIRILESDRVEVELSPYDLTKGRITRRL